MHKFIALTAACVLAATTAQAATVKVCTTDWPPYTISEGGKVVGTHTEMVTEAFKRLGHEVKIDSVAWERCMADVASGAYDAAYSGSFKAERAEFSIYPKEALQTLSYVAVVPKGTATGWDAAKDPAKLPQPVGAPRGYSVTGDLKKVAGVTVDEGSTNDTQNMQKLLAGRLKSAVMEASIAQYLIKHQSAEDKVDVLQPPYVANKDYFVLVSKKYGGSEASAQQFADQLNAPIAALKKEGFLAHVASKY